MSSISLFLRAVNVFKMSQPYSKP